MTIEVNDTNFEHEVLKSQLPVVVDFWASWCRPCDMIAPVIEEISNDYQGKIKVCKINVDDNPQLAVQFKIMSIPTVMIFKDGEVKDTLIGALPRANIVKLIEKYL